MEISERRVIGSLLLLLGVSFLAVAIYAGQMSWIIEKLKFPF